MKSPFLFIVKPIGRRYDNVKVIGGVEVLTSVSEEDFTASNRFLEVIETPIGYDGEIKIGATLVCHHNVTMFYNDMKGERKNGTSFFRDDLFCIDPEQFYAFNNGDGWKAHGRFTFVKPVPVIDNLGIKKLTSYEPLVGEMKYPNDYLRSKGVKEGDRVAFQPDSEYSFEIDGEKLFRMYETAICATL